MYYDQQIDHFSQVSFSGDATFKQRVLVNTDYFNSLRCKPQREPQGTGGEKRGSAEIRNGGADCPIFFYSGNEGPITAFYEASGFVMELAATYKVSLLLISCFVRCLLKSVSFLILASKLKWLKAKEIQNKTFFFPKLPYLVLLDKIIRVVF